MNHSPQKLALTGCGGRLRNGTDETLKAAGSIEISGLNDPAPGSVAGRLGT